MPDTWTEDEITHLYQVLSGDLQMCGCGRPWEAYALVSRILDWAADSTAEGAAPPTGLTAGGEGASHIIMSALDGAGLMDHGTTMRYPWLTPKGRAVRVLLARVTDWQALDESLSNGNAGYPHYPDRCTDACWARWDPERAAD